MLAYNRAIKIDPQYADDGHNEGVTLKLLVALQKTMLLL
jgi:hypothetical protein